MSQQERRKPAPAALVLGVFAGILAAIAVLPTAIPLTMRLAYDEHTTAVRHVNTAATFAAQLMNADGSVPQGTLEKAQVDHLHVVSPDGLLVFQDGSLLPPDIMEQVCGAEVASLALRSADGQQWATSCVTSDGFQVVAAWRPPQGAATEMVVLVLALALIVGIVTALGVLRLLAPLSRVSQALDRVGAGEHGVRLSATGMSELDELVERLNAAAESLELREREFLSHIQAIQEMARMVAHEVRNPLQSLELLTSLIVSEEDEEERMELARSIHQEIRALDMVVDRVLRQGVAGGRGMSLQKTSQSLRPLISQVMSLRGPEAKAQGITLEVGTVTDTRVEMDQALLGRSIENLVLNAMQAVPPHRGRIRVSAEVEDNHLCVVVEDNGPGVPSAFGDHIYEPNVSGRTGGTGLGLALVRGVVEAHGGHIEHDRSSLGGARFKARIPLSESEVEVGG
ncbi:MAG: HAMP domain-containing histidine kinase [Deltaproteobacteria bacterium]|nr:HAMP domain-containing histidine kinase [Deltaproteobacteria bacterium]MBW2253151.1 HAMP domain-containing histidine kinase [Deltaproteobacteria bacterium]